MVKLKGENGMKDFEDLSIQEMYEQIKQERMKKRETIYYFDKNNEITTKELATYAIIRVEDENGKLIEEVYGKVNNNQEDEEIVKTK